MVKKNKPLQYSKSIDQYDKEFLYSLLEQMLLARNFEDIAGQQYGLKKIGGFCHLYNGQEAVAIGSIAAIDLQKDYVITSYRDHVHALACGISPNEVMAELFGKATGCVGGRGGSMHMFNAKKHMFGGDGIVGGQIPTGAGLAFASAYRKRNGISSDIGISLTYFGDGAIHQGAFHETINIAAHWNIPILFMVENNFFAMGTSVKRASSLPQFPDKALSYGIEGYVINGQNVLEVYEATKLYAKRAREEEQPFLLDIHTYRYKGHSMSDPQTYRNKIQIEQFKLKDPINTLREQMIEANYITTDEFKALHKKTKDMVKESVQFANESPEPALDTLHNHILA